MKRRNKNAAVAVLLGIVASISVVSCITTDYSIGSDYAPSDQDLRIHTATLDLPVGQKMADSIQSTCYAMSFGSLYDEDFGHTQVDLAATITPYDTGFVFPPIELITVTRALIIGTLENSFTLVDNQDRIFQHFEVFQLDKALDSTTLFSNSITEKDYSKKISLGTTFFDGSDSLVVFLDTDFAKSLLNATRTELDTMKYYIQTHKGIYFKADETSDVESGGRINNFSHLSLDIEYKYLDTVLKVVKDTSASFTIGASDGYAIHSFRHSTQKYEVDVDNDRQTIAYEGLAGIKPFVSGQTIKNLLDEFADSLGVDPKRIMIARASMILPYEDPADYELMNYYPSGLFPCTRSANSKDVKQYTPLFTIYDASFSKGSINTSLNYYKPDITMFAQDLLMADRDSVNSSYDLWLISPYEYVIESSNNNSLGYYDYTLYDAYGAGGYGYTSASMYNTSYYSQLMASMYASSSSSQTYYYADYINYAKGFINGNGAVRRPKLEICYTILKEQ